MARGKERAIDFVDVRGKTVLELGAGTGLPGLVACVMGAGKTVITDYPDPHVIDNLKQNLDLALLPSTKKERQPNPHYLRSRQSVEVLGLGWGNEKEEARVLSAASKSQGQDGVGGYDLVLAADVLWVSSAHPLLIQSIRKMLKRDRNARCVLIAGFHTGRPAVRRFFVQLARPDDGNDSSLEQGRQSGIIPDWEEERFGGIWERNIDGSQRAWASAKIPTKVDYDAGSAIKTLVDDANEESEAEEEMGDISDRGSWVVVTSLRWADLM